jgi:hypothetical protein
LRAGNTIGHSVQVASDVAKVADIANDAARTADTLGRSATQIGKAIHNDVGTVLDDADVLSSDANNFFKGANGATGRQPDLSWGNVQGVWADLTTAGKWGAHVAKYGANFGEGIPLLYKAGEGLTNVTSLLPFMGVTSMIVQDAASYSGNASVSAGAPYNNPLQSAYGK